MSVPASSILALLLSQSGDPYRLGAEADPRDPNPRAFDCSEFVEWACGRCGVRPTMPDGAWQQFLHCRSHHTLVPIGTGIATPGALLFRVVGAHGGGGAGNHVAVSLGNNKTIEARGRKWGVGSWSALNRGWTHAALIPGVAHNPASRPPPLPPASLPTPPPIHRPTEDDDMGSFIRDANTGHIFHVYGERFRHLSGPQWKKREFLGARAETLPGETVMALLGDLIQDPT